MSVPRLMKETAIRIESYHVNEGMDMVVKKRVTEREHGIDRIGRRPELAFGESPMARQKFPVGAIMRRCRRPFITEKGFQIPRAVQLL